MRDDRIHPRRVGRFEVTGHRSRRSSIGYALQLPFRDVERAEIHRHRGEADYCRRRECNQHGSAAILVVQQARQQARGCGDGHGLVTSIDADRRMVSDGSGIRELSNSGKFDAS